VHEITYTAIDDANFYSLAPLAILVDSVDLGDLMRTPGRLVHLALGQGTLLVTKQLSPNLRRRDNLDGPHPLHLRHVDNNSGSLILRSDIAKVDGSSIEDAGIVSQSKSRSGKFRNRIEEAIRALLVPSMLVPTNLTGVLRYEVTHVSIFELNDVGSRNELRLGTCERGQDGRP
jgi:hypothetical protein